ncbi:MAG: homoserine kinase, partial [Planctomycetota bacterium]
MSTTAPLPHRVRVAGSSSNLGPGFDCLGLALSLFVDASVLERRREPGHAYGPREGAAREWSGGADDLFLRAVDAAAGRAALEPGWVFGVSSDVPLARGLGSSGAAVAAGLLLGAELAGRSDREKLLALGLELEGHPDNVVASLLGGLTVGVPTPEAPTPLARVSSPFHASLGVVVAWSADRMPTERARAVLPTRVDRVDAIENARRLALLLSGLASGDLDLVAAGSLDRLHERYR